MGWEFDGDEDAFNEYCNQYTPKTFYKTTSKLITNSDSVLNFGIHKGRQLKNVLYGLESSTSKRKTIELFIKRYLNFITQPILNYDFIFPEYFFEINQTRGMLLLNHKIDFLNELKFNIENNNSDNIISIWYTAPIKYQNEDNITLLKDILTSKFNGKNLIATHSKDRHKTRKSELSIESLNVISDFSYLKWCVSNLDKFIIEEYIMKKTHFVSSLEKFELTNKNILIDSNYLPLDNYFDGVIHLKPIIKSETIQFSKEEIELNKSKIYGA